MVKADNDRRQEIMDETGRDPDRKLDVGLVISAFNASY
jgi:hypothetical protein